MNESQKVRFIAAIRESTRPVSTVDPEPLPQEFANRLFHLDSTSEHTASPLGKIRAVLLDVYGTLFSSAAGDIGVGMDYARGNLDALAGVYAPTLTGEELKDYFRSAVIAEHERLFPQTPYPEVRVEELWAHLPGLAPAVDPEELALRFELAVNPVTPMEGLKDVLSALKSGGVTLGIVSNAQFFTPLLFDAFLGADLGALGFDSELLIYSYERRLAKPSPDLFAIAKNILFSRGIAADAVLYLGNDMLNDVYAARSAGFKTCLFAGDGRSLRLRRDNRLCARLLPDAVIRCLADLPPLVGLASPSGS